LFFPLELRFIIYLRAESPAVAVAITEQKMPEFWARVSENKEGMGCI
jgi:hypothetical protein